MTTGCTPSQTIGPFFHRALLWDGSARVVPEGTPGAIWLRGEVTDGAGQPVDDALVETWQADPEGHFDHPSDAARAAGWRGFGRCATNVHGAWAVLTVKPGRVPGPGGGLQAPHVDVSVFGRGLLHRLVTRLYFADETDANQQDAVLRRVEPQRRRTLLAAADEDGYRFCIRLQGEGETVFLDV